MGYVYKGARSEHWYAAWEGPDGKLRRRSTGTRNKTEARNLMQRWKLEAMRQKIAGVEVTYPDITFREFAAKYLRHSRAANSKATTQRDRGIINRVLEIMGQNKVLLEIRRRDVQDYLDRRASTILRPGKKTEKRIAPLTVEREKIGLAAMFTYAVNNEYIPMDAHPVKKVKIAKGESKKQRILTPEEEKTLVSVCRENKRLSYFEPIIAVAVTTGMREGEILSLKWANVEVREMRRFDGTQSYGRIIVESTNDNPTKDRTTRTVPVSKDLAGVLKLLRVQASKGSSGEEIRDQFVFVNPKTKTRWIDTKAAWASARKRANLLGLRFHDLRHTFATRARLSGMPLEVLKDILGHSDISTTMRYAHVGSSEPDKYINMMCKAGAAPRKGTKKAADCG